MMIQVKDSGSPAFDVAVEQRDDHGKKHSDRGNLISATSRVSGTKHLDAENKQHRSDDVGNVNEVFHV